MSQSPKHQDRLHPSADQIDLPLRNPREAKSMAQQNRLLKKQNQLLRRQLQNFSIKLDLQIRKKAEEYMHKPWSKQEDVTQKELQNAYKQCEIYKREASFYRKRVDALSDEQSSHEYEWKAKQLEQENKQMADQIVSLKKIIKIQEKGLSELGGQGYLNLVAEKEKLQEEVRILNKQIDSNRRHQRTESQSIPRITHSKVHQTTNKAKVDEENSTKRRFETQSSVKSVKEKEDKDSIKLKLAIAQRDRLRQQNGKYKQELIEKAKQIQRLKLRIQNLRKNNNQLLSQLNIKKSYIEESSLMQKDEENKSRVASKPRKWTKSTPLSKNVQRVDPLQKKESSSSQFQSANILKWSHEAFASKMLQIQLLVHQKGHIQDIHARYEKGQPKRYSSWRKNTFSSLSCREGEYIKHISGCFSEGYLQCLSVVTSDKRSQIFGNSQYLQMDKQCDKFQFSIDNQELPGALYGENDHEGVKKLGCVIIKK